MSRELEAHTRPKTLQLTHFMPRQRERGSADAGFLRRAGGTAPLLTTKPGRQAEESFTPPIRWTPRGLIQFGQSRRWSENNPRSGPKQARLDSRLLGVNET